LDIFGRSVESDSAGTGFIITNDGMIVTNKHVVSDENASYKVYTADGKDYDAKVMARDPYNDFAVLKIEASGLPVVDLGEFDNSVTVGVISAKDRQITATSGGQSETLDGLLQTDAAINSGNSGGPLVNLKGQVVGINTAVASNAQNIGFAIPINIIKSAIDSIKETGQIKRPMLGIRYLSITKEIAKSEKLAVDHGAWILRGSDRTATAIVSGSPADKAGLKENDIIIKINGEEINEKKSLTSILQQYDVNDEVNLTYLRDGQEKTVKVKLDEMK